MKLYEVENPPIKWLELDGGYAIRQAVGNAIGADAHAHWPHVGAPWPSTEMIGGGGSYVLRSPQGMVLLDAAVAQSRMYGTRIVLSQISAEKRGSGIGTKIMNALKTYADQKGMPLEVWKATITGRKFFDRFDWLENVDVGEYKYVPS